jgi:hypothetical protein
VASRKLAVVRAVLYQLRTQEEVLETFSISEEEFCAWVERPGGQWPLWVKNNVAQQYFTLELS